MHGPFEKGQHFCLIPPGPSEKGNTATLDASSSGCLFFIGLPVSMVTAVLIAHPHPGLQAHSLWTSAGGGALWAAVRCSSRTLTTPWVVAMAVLHPRYNYPEVYWQCTCVHRIKKSHFSINHSSQVVAKASVLRSLGYKATMAIIHH